MATRGILVTSMSLNQLKSMDVKIPKECGRCRVLACIERQVGDLGRVGALGADPAALGRLARVCDGASH